MTRSACYGSARYGLARYRSAYFRVFRYGLGAALRNACHSRIAA